MVDYPDIDVAEAEWIDQDNFVPRYNIAPRSNAPVIRRADDGNLAIHTMKWGVVPHWSKHEDLTLNTINARAENLMESGGMWASMKHKKRCVVVCDGYFEWLKRGKDRLPHFVRRKDGKLMILAGLFDSAILEGATSPMWTFTIVTTDAAPSFSWLHDRQPVILSSTADFEAWLDTSKSWHAGLTKIVGPQDVADLESFPVPKEVGRVGTNSSSFIQPVAQRKDGIEAMFAKQAAKSKQESPSKQEHVSASLQDGKTAKRSIEIDVSPPPTPSPSGPHSSKKQKLSHSHQGKVKRILEEEADGSPVTKRTKTESTLKDEGETPKRHDGHKPRVKREAISPEPKTQSQLKVKGSSSPNKTPKSKRGADDSGSLAKITAFFRPHAREPAI